MISAWELYWWTRLEVIGPVAFFSLLVLAGLAFVYCISVKKGVGYSGTDADVKRAKFIKDSFLWKALLVFIAASLFIPSKKDAAMIWIIPQMATIENAELLKGEAAEIYKMAKDALKDVVTTD